MLYDVDGLGRTPVQVCLIYLVRHNRLDYLVWLLTVARVPFRTKNSEGKNCYDLVKNNNKKFEKNVKEVLDFTEKQRRKDLNRALLIINISSKSKIFNLLSI